MWGVEWERNGREFSHVPAGTDCAWMVSTGWRGTAAPVATIVDASGILEGGGTDDDVGG
jgi:hypothetical protein